MDWEVLVSSESGGIEFSSWSDRVGANDGGSLAVVGAFGETAGGLKGSSVGGCAVRSEMFGVLRSLGGQDLPH